MRRFRILIYIFLIELTARTFLAVYFLPMAFLHPDQLWLHYYPVLSTLKRREDPHKFQVALVGASVLAGGNGFGSVEKNLEEAFRNRGVSAEFYNLAMPAHTSLDAWLKYRFAREKQFDLVLYYEGFNEIRANNINREHFKSDYSHYGWYRRIQTLHRHPEIGVVAFPFVTDILMSEVFHKLGGNKDLPVHQPNIDQVHFGLDVKTGPTLRANVEHFLRLSHEKNEPAIIVTPASYIPIGYSKEGFLRRELDYADHTLPVELWGSVEGVLAAVKIHREVLINVVKMSRQQGINVSLLDFASILPKGKKYFNDVCHLTDHSSRILAELIVESLQKREPAIHSG